MDDRTGASDTMWSARDEARVGVSGLNNYKAAPWGRKAGTRKGAWCYESVSFSLRTLRVSQVVKDWRRFLGGTSFPSPISPLISHSRRTSKILRPAARRILCSSELTRREAAPPEKTAPKECTTHWSQETAALIISVCYYMDKDRLVEVWALALRRRAIDASGKRGPTL